MSPTLYLIRGLSGTGKSTLAQRIAPAAHFEADQYFVGEDGVYRWDRARIAQAHADCQARVEAAMRLGFKTIAVSNTFSQHWELEPYRKLAELHGFTVLEVTMTSAPRGNVHDVPPETIAAMRQRWER